MLVEHAHQPGRFDPGHCSQVASRGVAGDRRHGMSAQDVVSCATSFVPVVVEPAGWPAAVTRAMDDSDR